MCFSNSSLDGCRASYAPSKRNQKSDSASSSRHSSPEVIDLEIPLPPERDSTSPTPQAPKPPTLKETRGDLLAGITDCERLLTKEGQGMEVVECATLTIRLAQRYRAQIRHEDWEDEKKLRRDAFDVLTILKGIAEREGRDVNEDEKSVINKWCKDVRARVERDDEVRRQMWERAVSWMDGSWEGKEWGTLPHINPTLT